MIPPLPAQQPFAVVVEHFESDAPWSLWDTCGHRLIAADGRPGVEFAAHPWHENGDTRLRWAVDFVRHFWPDLAALPVDITTVRFGEDC